MGMYDTLHFSCPACGKMTTRQSNYGDCTLRDYSLHDAPLLVIADINDDGKRGALYCEHCSAKLELEVRFVAAPKVADVEAGDNSWRCV